MFTRKYGLQRWEKSSSTRVDKFAVCVEKDQTVVGRLKKTLESSQKRFFTSSKKIPTVTVMLKF